MQPSTIPNANDQVEYIDLKSKIAKAEAKLVADEALADAQERDLRNEGVTQYESARFTGKLREEARTAKFKLANMKTQQAVIEPAMKPPARDPQGASITQAHQTTQPVGLPETLLGENPPGLLFELAGAAGASGASALVSAYQDYGDTIAQSMEGLGVDFNDPDQVAAAWNNEAMRKEILDAASKEWKNSALNNLITGFIGNVAAGRAIPIRSGDPLYDKFVKVFGQEATSTLFGTAVQELTPDSPGYGASPDGSGAASSTPVRVKRVPPRRR